jgi:hypothetical protein
MIARLEMAMSVQASTTQAEHVFYPMRDGVLVTDRGLHTGPYTYRWHELSCLRVRPGAMHVARRAALEIIAIEVGLALFVVGLVVLVTGPNRLALVVAGVHLVTAAVLGMAACVRWRSALNLWADHRGIPTMLFRSHDRTEFWKVFRAIGRAAEYRRSSEHWLS